MTGQENGSASHLLQLPQEIQEQEKGHAGESAPCTFFRLTEIHYLLSRPSGEGPACLLDLEPVDQGSERVTGQGTHPEGEEPLGSTENGGRDQHCDIFNP